MGMQNDIRYKTITIKAFTGPGIGRRRVHDS